MLILARHGRTAANAGGLLQGRTDLPLDDVGTRQARRLGEVLRGADRVIASPLQRAVQTAAMISGDVEIDARWLELDYGVLDGVPLSAVDPQDWARWQVDPDFAPAGGESLTQLSSRLLPALVELSEQARHQTVVVVSHVSPIKAAVAWALGAGVELSWRCQVDQASISRVVFGPRGPALKTFNETAHLD